MPKILGDLVGTLSCRIPKLGNNTWRHGRQLIYIYSGTWRPGEKREAMRQAFRQK